MSCSGFAEFDEDTAGGIIDDFAAMGGRSVEFYGGEPTCHPAFPELFRRAARIFPAVRLITNGAYLVRADVRAGIRDAAAATQVAVRVSLNAGSAPTHDAGHGVQGYFPRIVEGVYALAAEARSARIGISYLLDDENAGEIGSAFEIAARAGAEEFWLRAKTGSHGIGVIPIAPESRAAACEQIRRVCEIAGSGGSPAFHIEPWHERYLQTGTADVDTDKSYPSCYSCGASRVVVTPPGNVYACTYWRADERFLICRLADAPLGSPEFDSRRLEVLNSIRPAVHCADVICNRSAANTAVWSRRAASRAA